METNRNHWELLSYLVDDPRLLKQVLLYFSTFYHSCRCEVDVYILAKSAGVVIPDCLGISKCCNKYRSVHLESLNIKGNSKPLLSTLYCYIIHSTPLYYLPCYSSNRPPLCPNLPLHVICQLLTTVHISSNKTLIKYRHYYVNVQAPQIVPKIKKLWPIVVL